MSDRPGVSALLPEAASLPSRSLRSWRSSWTDGLVVHPEIMRRNLDLTGGSLMAEAVMMRLDMWAQLERVSGKSSLAEAIRFALRHMDGLGLFLDDGRVELDTNGRFSTSRTLTRTRYPGLDRPALFYSLGSLVPAPLRLHLLDGTRRRLTWLARRQHVPERAVKSLARFITSQFPRRFDEALSLVLVLTHCLRLGLRSLRV